MSDTFEITELEEALVDLEYLLQKLLPLPLLLLCCLPLLKILFFLQVSL